TGKSAQPPETRPALSRQSRGPLRISSVAFSSVRYIELMRLLFALAAAFCAAAQPPRLTLDQVLGAPFHTELTGSPTGKVAWISNARGVRNVLVAEPPRYEPRKVTAYTAD